MRDYITNTVAGAALISPYWYSTLAGVSEQAALWLPILGGLWLFVQVIAKLIEIYRWP